MPVAWFIAYWQQRTNDTSGQNWVIRIGLLICTLGFGRQCCQISLAMSDFQMCCRIVEPFVRESERCRWGNIPFDCGHWHRNALSRSISSLYKSAQTLGASHRNQRIFSCSLHRRNCGSGEPFWAALWRPIKPHEGSSWLNILQHIVEASPISHWSCLDNQLQWYQISSAWIEGRGCPCGVLFYQSMVLLFENC